MTATADKPLLEIRNLRITVGSSQPFAKAIVDDISLSLRRGEVIGLIGESGAGKSTIGLAALGHFRGGCHLAGGSIVFDGIELPKLPHAQLARLRGTRMTYIAQSAAAAFNPAWPLIKQVCEVPVLRGLMSRKEAEQKAIALFRELELPNPETFGERYPHQVSGGQLQRAMAAMAMITDPDLLVFDEPTTALDTTTQFEVLVAFRRLLRNRNAAALYITHDMGVVAQVADRILVLRHGRMVESSDTASTLERPQQSYTRELVSTRARHYPPALETASEQPMLIVEGLEASYSPKIPLLQDINFTIRPGETLALVGESGSGKSTVSRVICGLLKPRAGRIVLKGEALPGTLRRRNRDHLRRVQLIHQQPDIALNPRQSIRSIVARPVQQFFGRSRREAEKRADELLAAMGLPPGIGKLYPPNLSGGQKQRVCIARALAAEPDLLICDEITSALDPVTAKEIVALLVELQGRLKTAFLFISHQLEIVSSLAHRTAVMQSGRIVELTETARLFEPPHHPYTHKLVTSLPESRVGWLDEALAERGRAAG